MNKYSVSQILTILLLQLFAVTGMAVASSDYRSLKSDEISEEYLLNAGIDSLDTIYFDLRNLNTAGTTLEFPVYLKSDDSVYAMDFSFKYNALLFNFDSITSVQTNFQYLFNFTPFDSTVYFTSYSLGGAYQNNANVVNTRFNLIGSLQSLSVNDIHHALGYLNGDVCPVKIIAPSLTNIESVNTADFSIYPNPASDELTIVPFADGVAFISDLTGKQMGSSFRVSSASLNRVDVSAFPGGVYILSLQHADGSISQARLIISQ